MNPITTRSRAKKIVDAREDQENDCSSTMNNYCKIIENLKKRLKEKEILNNTLLDEQETNAKEFEIICKQVQQFKKKAYEDEEKVTELHKLNLQLLNDNSLLREDKELWENQQLCVTISELEKKVDLQSQENTELQLRYSQLLFKATSSTKKGYKCIRKRVKNGRDLKDKYKQVNIKIKQLISVNTLIQKELVKRENVIRALEDEGDKFLEMIRKYETDLKERDITYDKVLILEEQLIKLQKLIEKKVQVHDVAAKLQINVLREKANDRTYNGGSNNETIVMFSDRHGRNMVKEINNKLPYDYTVVNFCKPHNDYCNILNDVCIQKPDTKDTIILIGDYSSIQMDIYGYLTKIDSIAKFMNKHKKKLIVSTISYRVKNELNQKIFKLNSKLFTIAALNENMSIIEINTPKMGELAAKYIASSIAVAYAKKESCRNLVVLTKGNDLTEEVAKPTENFTNVWSPEVVK